MTTKKTTNSSKSTSEYWKDRIGKRNLYRNGQKSQTANYYARISVGGKQIPFNLGSGNKLAAAKKAAEIYNFYLSTKDAQATLEKYRNGDKSLIDGPLTVGDYFRAYEQAQSDELKPETLNSYRVKFYTLVAEIAKIHRNDNSKFDYFNKKADEWRKKIETVKLSRITPAALENWKVTYIENAVKTGRIREKAQTTANTILRNSKSLFSKKVVSKIRRQGQIKIPDDFRNPFEEIKIQSSTMRAYRSKITPKSLIKRANEELNIKIPTEPKLARQQAEYLVQAYRIFLLAISGGLRRNEVDGLRWDEVDFREKCLHVKSNKWRTLKSDESERTVYLNDNVIKQLEVWFKTRKGDFLIESPTKPRTVELQKQLKRNRTWYRCENSQKKLIKWLREQGISEIQALHELRKEYGSQIYAATGDILIASKLLGHATLEVTKRSYVETTKKVTVDY